MQPIRTILLAAIKNALLIWGLAIISLVLFSGDLSADKQFFLYVMGIVLISVHFAINYTRSLNNLKNKSFHKQRESFQ
jgi:hypothetical protein